MSSIPHPDYAKNVKNSLISKVLVHDIDNWFRENNSIKVQNSWEIFKKEIREGDEVWSYRFGGALRMRKGYAIVRNGEISNCFQTAMS